MRPLKAVTLAVLLLTIAAPTSFAQDLGLDDLINQVFSKPSEQPGTVTTLAPQRSTPAVGSQATCEPGARCVQRYLCSNSSTSGEGLIDIRFSDDNPCVDYLLQCCFEEDIIQAPPSHPPPDVKPPPQHPPPPGPDPKVPVTHQPVCGRRNADGIGFRITGSKNNEAEYGEFPWMVAVLKTEEVLGQLRENVYQCGGSLIHPQVVMTGAHCVQNKLPSQLKIRAGEWDTQTSNEIFPHQDRSVVESVVHEQFYKGGLHNNIALLFLDSPLELNDGIQPVCLPPAGTNFDHQTCFASGWGKDVYGKAGTYQVILKKIDLPVVPRDQCQKALKTTRLGAKFTLHNSFICAGGIAGKDTCKGDGGSPLVCPISGSYQHYYQAGIVSWGIGCGENQIPGVYTDVSGFRAWIDQNMKQRGFDGSSYQANVA